MPREVKLKKVSMNREKLIHQHHKIIELFYILQENGKRNIRSMSPFCDERVAIMKREKMIQQHHKILELFYILQEKGKSYLGSMSSFCDERFAINYWDFEQIVLSLNGFSFYVRLLLHYLQ